LAHHMVCHDFAHYPWHTKWYSTSNYYQWHASCGACLVRTDNLCPSSD
jgi:hypothetical protein